MRIFFVAVLCINAYNIISCVSCCRNVRTMQTQSREDESALSNLLAEKQLFLERALKNYILCLRTGVR